VWEELRLLEMLVEAVSGPIRMALAVWEGPAVLAVRVWTSCSRMQDGMLVVGRQVLLDCRGSNTA